MPDRKLCLFLVIPPSQEHCPFQIYGKVMGKPCKSYVLNCVHICCPDLLEVDLPQQYANTYSCLGQRNLIRVSCGCIQSFT